MGFFVILRLTLIFFTYNTDSKLALKVAFCPSQSFWCFVLLDRSPIWIPASTTCWTFVVQLFCV